MNRQDPKNDRSRETRTEPRREERDLPERTTAPPIEREHETSAGIFEEDERRERKGEERERKGEEDERRERKGEHR
jgi:hypothetical protein